MKCPFLRESWVKSCQAAPFKKVIEQTADSAADLCTSTAFHGCAAFKEQRRSGSAPPCPFLHASRAQVCSHDPAVRLVPCSENVLSRCVTENHHYCEIYQTAHRNMPATREAGKHFQEEMPPHFFFTRNHMWLDVSMEQDCHIGLDALLTRVLGRVDKLSFVTCEGEQCPSLVLTAHGMNLHMVFPNPMRITAANAQVRVDPERILHDPYGAGWLFEGIEAPGTDIRSGLRSGDGARSWMKDEIRRVTDMLHSHAPEEKGKHNALAADGGFPVEGAIRYMRRNEIAHFFEALFKNEEAL